MGNQTTKLQRICAWCKKDMDTGRQLTDEEYKALELEATHGICPECSEKEAVKPPPDAHKFSANIDEANVGVSGGGSSKGTQLDLFSISKEAGTANDAHSAANSNGGSTKSVAASLSTCQTCFRYFTGAEMGIDGRYCKECEGNLNDEWQAMAQRGVKIKPGWVPRITNEPRRINKKHNGNGSGNGIKELPIKKIKTMAAEGMSSKRIAAELIKQGYVVNYRTIAKMGKGSGRNGNPTRQSTKAKRLPTTSKA